MTVSSALEKRLAAVGLDPAGAGVLALLPLVHVAWADGAVQAAERRVIDEQAARLGASADGLLMLRNWLAFPPSETLVQRGHEALVALLAESGPGRPAPKAILAYCRRVSLAAGGLLGVGSTSRAEQQAITQIARALQVAPGRSWVGAPTAPQTATRRTPPKPVTVTFRTQEVPGVRATAVLVGEHGHRCPIDVDGIVVGRGAESDVQVGADAKVSRRHCRLEERARRYYVRDLESTSGTWVDGDRVLERRLFGGEVLWVGASTFRFELLHHVLSAE